MHSDRLAFLKQLKQYGIAHNIPNISWETAEFLHVEVRKKNPKTILEIGTANGFSTIWMADGLLGGLSCSGNGVTSKRSIVTIERSAPAFKEAIQNFEETEVETLITPIYGDAKLILKDWRSPSALKQIQTLDDVPKGPQYLEGAGLVYSSLTIEQLPSNFDLIFIDAQKMYYAEFWQLVQPLLKPDSLIIVDDVLKFQHKTESFNAMVKRDKNWRHEIHQTDEDDGVMLIWKA